MEGGKGWEFVPADMRGRRGVRRVVDAFADKARRGAALRDLSPKQTRELVVYALGRFTTTAAA